MKEHAMSYPVVHFEITGKDQMKLSIMPAGLQQTMSTQELVDLVEYLSSLKKRP